MAHIKGKNAKITLKSKDVGQLRRDLIVAKNMVADVSVSSAKWCQYCFNTHDKREHAECEEAAIGVYGSEPFWTPEYVEAWRGFKIVVDPHGRITWTEGDAGRNYSPILRGMRATWPNADPGPAECIRNDAGLGFAHKSPHPMCTCGYHALKNRENIDGSFAIHAQVILWGEGGTTGGGIIEHEDGYRSERIKIVGLDYTNRGAFMFQRRERVHGTLGKLREIYEVGGLT